MLRLMRGLPDQNGVRDPNSFGAGRKPGLTLLVIIAIMVLAPIAGYWFLMLVGWLCKGAVGG
jgi:hypothetical protein